MNLLTRLLSFILSGLIFFAVINYIEPPPSWLQASTFQILVFFISLTLTLTLLINLFLWYLPRSLIWALGIVSLLVFYSQNIFNIVTAPLVLAATIFLATSFPKLKYRLKFRKSGNIPGLKNIGGQLVASPRISPGSTSTGRTERSRRRRGNI